MQYKYPRIYGLQYLGSALTSFSGDSGAHLHQTHRDPDRRQFPGRLAPGETAPDHGYDVGHAGLDVSAGPRKPHASFAHTHSTPRRNVFFSITNGTPHDGQGHETGFAGRVNEHLG